ncbi:MAG: hypothetical protein IE931_02790 [Sphingobacteriales bacterium]|nr:hypothetical protein [Sphingobacteriales bacterium]
MKKLSTSVSPFLMMIIPVMLFVGLSLSLKDRQVMQDEFVSGNTPSKTTILVKVGEESLLRFLLKK